MIRKYYEIECDACGNADYGTFSIKNAEYQYKNSGGIVINGHHFCDHNCLDRYKKHF